MKLNSSLKYVFAGSLAVLALSVLPFAKAGPGIDYWKRTSGFRSEIPAAEKASVPAHAACTDMKMVEVTQTRNAWQNGRGPLTTAVLGTKMVCTSCAKSASVAKREWRNGKGPLVSTQVKSEHTCVSCGAM